MEDRLPRTRKELLKDILRYRFLDIVVLSLLMGLVFVVRIVLILFVETTFLSEVNIFNSLIKYVLNIISFIIFFLGLGGAFYFTKKLAWSEGSNIRRDFFEGVFKNAKKSVLSGIILGFIYGGIHLLGDFFSVTSVFSYQVEYVFLGISYAFFILLACACFYVLTQSMIYEDKFIHLFINGIKFSLGNGLKTILCLLLLFPLILIEFFNNEIVFLIAFCLLVFFLFGLFIISFTLISHELFDKTINAKQYQEIIKKGLKKDED